MGGFRSFGCDWDYNSQGSVIEGFPMSEVVCLVSRVVFVEVAFLFCIELGGHTKSPVRACAYCL
jgi:hypothetical protein